MNDHQIITRRNLPHWYVPGAAHFITYRLADTIPAEVLHRLRSERDARLQHKPAGLSPAENRHRAHKVFFAAYDRYLDHTCKIDWLAQPRIAAMIRGNLHHHNGSKYYLLAYCIMPNHVHVLLQPPVTAGGSPAVGASVGALAATAAGEPPAVTGDETPDGLSPLASIMHSLKSYTAHQANRLLGRSGRFWLGESYDHWVRDDDELERIVNYIAANPVQARLVGEPHCWFFCSAHDRFLQDGELCGWLSHDTRSP
jgi:putative DNA methylase